MTFQYLDNNHDRLQPSQQQLDLALAFARTYWHVLANQAKADLSQGVSNVSTRCLLRNVPPIPAEPVCTYNLSSYHTKALAMKTSSTWRVFAGAKCDVDGKQKEIKSNLWIGLQNPTKVELSGECFQQWPPQGLHVNTPNYLAILALAWSYILSARMVELQGEMGAEVLYTKSVSAGLGRSSETVSPSDQAITFDIGRAKTVHARWWAAILAPHQGWQAIVSQQGGGFRHLGRFA